MSQARKRQKPKPQKAKASRFKNLHFASCIKGAVALNTAPRRVISSVVERFVHIEDVRSSNLLSPTIFSKSLLIPCEPGLDLIGDGNVGVP